MDARHWASDDTPGIWVLSFYDRFAAKPLVSNHFAYTVLVRGSGELIAEMEYDEMPDKRPGARLRLGECDPDSQLGQLREALKRHERRIRPFVLEMGRSYEVEIVRANKPRWIKKWIRGLEERDEIL